MVDWNKYPDTVPPDIGEYLVTTVGGKVDTDYWIHNWRAEQNEWYSYSDHQVKAWAELPEPYKENTAEEVDDVRKSD